MRRLKTVRRPPIYPKTPGHLPCSSLTHPLPLSSRRPSVSFGGFGLRPSAICSSTSACLLLSLAEAPDLLRPSFPKTDLMSWRSIPFDNTRLPESASRVAFRSSVEEAESSRHPDKRSMTGDMRKVSSGDGIKARMFVLGETALSCRTGNISAPGLFMRIIATWGRSSAANWATLLPSRGLATARMVEPSVKRATTCSLAGTISPITNTVREGSFTALPRSCIPDHMRSITSCASVVRMDLRTWIRTTHILTRSESSATSEKALSHTQPAGAGARQPSTFMGRPG